LIPSKFTGELEPTPLSNQIRPAILRFFHLFSTETLQLDSASCASKEVEKPQLRQAEVAVRLLIGGRGHGKALRDPGTALVDCNPITTML
jgi:hypothetical protein